MHLRLVAMHPGAPYRYEEKRSLPNPVPNAVTRIVCRALKRKVRRTMVAGLTWAQAMNHPSTRLHFLATRCCGAARLPRNRRRFTLPSCRLTVLKPHCPRMAFSRCTAYPSTAVSQSRSSCYLSPRPRRQAHDTRCAAPQSHCSHPPSRSQTPTGRLQDDSARYARLGVVGPR